LLLRLQADVCTATGVVVTLATASVV
jgi:hypothetical protein